MKKSLTKKLTRAGIIASLYIVLSLVTFGFNGGAIQLRLSEGLTLLALFYFEAIPALFVGCLLSNFISGLALIDILLGGVITLVAGTLTFLIGKSVKNYSAKIFLGGLFPVLLNALLLPLIWKVCYSIEYAYIIQALFLLASQSVSVYAFGAPITFAVKNLQDRGIDFLK